VPATDHPPRRRWLLKGLRSGVQASWAAGTEDIFIDGSVCTEKPDPGDIDGYWIEPDPGSYDRIDPLRSRVVVLPQVERLDQIAPFIVRVRIAKGVSQSELARRLGVSKQVVSRYEESDYQTVAVARLQEILDAVGIKTAVTLTA